MNRKILYCNTCAVQLVTVYSRLDNEIVAGWVCPNFGRSCKTFIGDKKNDIYSIETAKGREIKTDVQTDDLALEEEEN